MGGKWEVELHGKKEESLDCLLLPCVCISLVSQSLPGLMETLTLKVFLETMACYKKMRKRRHIHIYFMTTYYSSTWPVFVFFHL